MNSSKETLSNSSSNIEIIYAGGTISSLATPQGYREGGHVVDLMKRFEAHTPHFRGRFALGETAVAYTGLSENLDETYLNAIEQKVNSALKRHSHATVITHGTDSMEQTARFLDARFATTLNDTDARVILTGANDDISVATSDAWDNLAFALESADSDAEPGVYVAFHDKLIPARLVVKEPFDGTSMNYTALDDPEYLEAIQKQLKHSQLQVSQLETAYGRKAMSSKVVDYPVNIIRPNHQELLDYIDTHDVETILLTFYHSSTANTEKPEMSVAELAKKLIAKRGIVLFGVTENGEPCRFDGYETSIRLHEAGIVPLGAMLHDVALAKLQLLSETGLVHEPLKAAMLAT